ncbi:MAG: S1C family serine protease [Candidatus Eiseniibacteriota bacterium]
MTVTPLVRTTIVALLALAGCAPGGPEPAPPPRPITLSYPYLTPDEATLPGFRALAERAAPGYVELTILAPGQLAPGEQRGVIHVASGMIVDRAGHILTAAHIARGTDYYARVRLVDGRIRDARILNVAPLRELALLEMAPLPDLNPISFAAPDSLQRGDFVMAIGSPSGKAGVVTLGTVRLPDIKQRLDYNEWGFDHAIEMSMEVESGHSGGPVFDRDGKVVGMIAGYELGDTTRTPYISPRIAYAVPAADMMHYLTEQLGR